MFRVRPSSTSGHHKNFTLAEILSDMVHSCILGLRFAIQAEKCSGIHAENEGHGQDNAPRPLHWPGGLELHGWGHPTLLHGLEDHKHKPQWQKGVLDSSRAHLCVPKVQYIYLSACSPHLNMFMPQSAHCDRSGAFCEEIRYVTAEGRK